MATNTQTTTAAIEEIRANARALEDQSLVLLAELLPNFEERFTRGERITIGRQLARMVRSDEVPELEWYGRTTENHQQYSIVPEDRRQTAQAA